MEMHELTLRLKCKNPVAAKASLDPDIKNTDNMQIEITTDSGFIEIRVKAAKLGHMKGVMNSYLSIVGLLNEVDDLKLPKRQTE
jgi:tRNA threonylcarbamoyladenosine modification (KEOPS) complex  Pcc1 subunit